MSTLKGLNPSGRSLVTEDFRRGDPARVDADPYVEPLDLGREVSLAPVQGVIAEAMRRQPDPQKSDSWLGPRIHATLRLTRREAADKRIWEYLTVVQFPDYVRWRWQVDDPEKAVPLDRFLGEDSKNALARLWWATELTRNGRDYTRSETALTISRFSVSWLHLILAHHRAAALAVVDFLETFQEGKRATDTQGQVMAKATNVALRTLCLDALAASPPVDTEAVREWIAKKIDETTMMDELPEGPDEAPIADAEIASIRKFLDDLADRIQLSDAVKTDSRPAEMRV